MISLGLSATSQRTLLNLLASHHTIHVKVQILDLSHNYLGDVSNRFVDGQIDYDYQSKVTRSLKLILLDPSHTLHLDTNSPDEGALFMDRMIRIIYTVMNPSGTFSVDIPLFCGPIRKLDRSGVLVNLECHGKEALLTPGLLLGKTYRKGSWTSAVIRSVLYDGGERKLSIANRTPKLPKDYAIGLGNTRWGVSSHLAQGLAQHLFYDGRGTAVMRSFSQLSVYNFNENVLKSKPQVSYDISNVINAVAVYGAPVKGTKKNLLFLHVADRNHPLSPWKLQRNGVPQVMTLVIKDDSLRTMSMVKARAYAELQRGLLQAVSVAFECLPGVGALLELADICRVNTPETNARFRLLKMSVPLTARGSTTIGYNKKLTPRYDKIRLRRR